MTEPSHPWRDPRPSTGAPKPANFEEMSAAWNDPDRFNAEVAKYRQQVSEYHQTRRAA